MEINEQPPVEIQLKQLSDKFEERLITLESKFNDLSNKTTKIENLFEGITKCFKDNTQLSINNQKDIVKIYFYHTKNV